MSPSIFVFIALHCEAIPLIKAWRLRKPAGKHPFSIYADERRVVVITGIGKASMAGAIGYTLALFPNSTQPIFLNLGIAGHRTYELGAIFLADKIIDQETQRRFFPQLLFSAPCPTATVATLAKPHNEYAETALYDMEASAFYELAAKFSSHELIHCLKIVSDNELSPMKNITETRVESWCEKRLTMIDGVLTQLSSLQKALPSMYSEEYQWLFSAFHVTASNEIKLRALLGRWRLQMAGTPLNWPEAEARSIKELIAWIERRLNEAEFYL